MSSLGSVTTRGGGALVGTLQSTNTEQADHSLTFLVLSPPRWEAPLTSGGSLSVCRLSSRRKWALRDHALKHKHHRSLGLVC